MESEKDVEDKQERLAERETMPGSVCTGADVAGEGVSHALPNPRSEEDITMGSTLTFSTVEVDDEAKANSLELWSDAILCLTGEKDWEVSSTEEADEEEHGVGTYPAADWNARADQDAKNKAKGNESDQAEKEKAEFDKSAVSGRPADLAEVSAALSYWKEDEKTGLGVPTAAPVERTRLVSVASSPGAVFVSGIGTDDVSTRRMSEVFCRSFDLSLNDDRRPSIPEGEAARRNHEEALIRASLVKEEPLDMIELEERLRKQILGGAVEARVLTMDESAHSFDSSAGRISMQSITASSNKWSIYVMFLPFCSLS
jgi:hypothetical protein